MANEAVPERFTVASWNILLDKTRGERVPSQYSRLPDIIATLDSFDAPLDVAALMEVERSVEGHHGEMIAEKLGCGPGFWTHHSRKGEHIGVYGAAVDAAEFVELGHNRKAAITMLGDVAIAGIHLKRPARYIRGTERSEEIEALLDHLGDRPAVVMGDFNGLAIQRARRLLGRQGFTSVFPLTGQFRPATLPMRDYEFMLSPREKRMLKLARRFISVDDIYVRDVAVYDAGIKAGASDHALLYATLGQDGN